METAQAVLVWVMKQMLKLLHPFMPFITEEIWQTLVGETPLMIEKFPVYDESLCFESEEKDFEKIITAIKGIRNRRAEMNVPPSKKAKVFIETPFTDVFKSGSMFFERLASASEVEVNDQIDLSDALTVVTDSARIFIPLDEIVDKEKELDRLNKEKKAVQKDIDFLSGKLSNEGFLAKAPAQLIEKEKAKLEVAKQKMEKILESIEKL